MAALQPVQLEDWQARPDEAGALHAELAGIAAALTTHFDATGTALADAVALIDQVVNALREVASVFDTGEAASAVDDLMSAAEGLRTVRAQADARASDIARIRESSVALRTCAGEIQRCIQVLGIYGMNVKITASGVEEFMQFADRMRDKLNAAGGEVKSLDDTLELLERSLCDMRHNDAMLVAECAKVVPQVPDRLMRDAEALKQHQAGLVRLAQATNAVAQTIRGELGLALGAIQIGDRVRQRLEHVMFGCQLIENAAAADDEDEACADALRKHLLPLLKALTTAAAAEFEGDAQSLLASLHRLADASGRLTCLKEPGNDENGEGFLTLLEGGIAEAEGMIAQFGQADRQGAAMLEQILSTVDDVAAKMAAITELRLEVRNMAINIGLSCRNVGELGKPIMVVANEIRTYSDRLDQIISAISNAGAALSETSARMNENRANGHSSIDQLSQFLKVIHECDDRTIIALDVVDSKAADMQRLLRNAIAELDRLHEKTRYPVEIVSLSDAAGSVDQTYSDDVIVYLNHVFEMLAKNYTMNSEREVHNLNVPDFVGKTHVGQIVSTDDIDDDDDGLF